MAIDKVKALEVQKHIYIPNWNVAAVFDSVAAAQAICNTLAERAGWWDGIDPMDPTQAAAKLALIHSEVSEALEGVRKGEMDSHLPHRKAEEVELADAMIRIFDLAGARGLDLAGAIVDKLAYNITRADHTREARAAAGGKVI